MAMALLLTLLLPVLQDDPQVTYREGLFEEVDQGNLEKAAELYGKILKSGAPDALKAKALLRIGFCHEKKGRKKEAEQAWRDVAERFPGAAETVKQARERLSSLNQQGANASGSLDEQVRSLVLDLIASDSTLRDTATRKLVVIGNPAVPELRKALSSRDMELRVSAAYVLVQLESYDGVYDALQPMWIKTGELDHRAAYTLGQTLKGREEDRKRFLKDLSPEATPALLWRISGQLCAIPDPAFSKLVEDWLVEADHAGENYFQSLTQYRDVADIKRLARRLAGAKIMPQEKVRAMLKSYSPKIKEVDPELKKIALECLSAESDPQRFLVSISVAKSNAQFHGWFLAYLTPREFVQGPLKTWLLRLPSNWLTFLLQMVHNMVNQEATRESEFAKELRQFQIDFIISKEYPKEIRRRVYDYTPYPESPDLLQKYVLFSLESFRDLAQDPESDGTTCTDFLMRRLPENSKDLAEVLEVGSRRGWLSHHALQDRKSVRSAGVEAAIRALKDSELPEGVVNHLLNVVEGNGSPEERATVGSALASIGVKYPHSDAVRIYHEGILALPDTKRDEAWKGYLAAFNGAPDPLKAVMAGRLVGEEGGHVQELMTKAAESAHAETRQVALQHWTEASHVDSNVRTAMLARGLKDTVEENQLWAVNGLMNFPDLNVVPAVIDALNSPFAKVRVAARKALDEIKKHYEAQAEWKRWYDETKKALGK